MHYVRAFIIKDVLRDRTCYSFKEAHEQYMPQVCLSTFIKMVKGGKISTLYCYEYKKLVDDKAELKKGKRILDVGSGHIWDSVSDAARFFGVSRQAVLKAARTGGRCRGRIVQFA